MSKTTMGRPELAAWLAEAGYPACGEQLAAVSTRQAPTTAHRIADVIDGTLAEHDELLPEKLREFAYVTDAWLEAPELCARLARAARAIRASEG